MKNDKYSIKELNTVLRKYIENHGGFKISKETMAKLPLDSDPNNKENGHSEAVFLLCEELQLLFYYCHKDRGERGPKGIYLISPIPGLPDLHMSMKEIKSLKPIIAIKDSNLAGLVKEMHNLTKDKLLKKYGVKPMPNEE